MGGSTSRAFLKASAFLASADDKPVRIKYGIQGEQARVLSAGMGFR